MRSGHTLALDGWREQLPKLRIFEEVARRRSFTVAARALGLSQPSVSRAVAALEAHLGSKLLERDGRELKLTDAGAKVAASARRIRDELDALDTEMRLESSAPRGDFVCFSAEHVATHILGGPIAALLAAHRGVVPRLITAPAHLAVPEIIEDRAEIGFFFKVEPHAKIEARPIASFKCQLVCHPNAATDRDVLTSFIGSREIDDRRNTSFPTLDMLRRHRPETKISLSSNSLALHAVWVRLKLGISILPLFVVGDALARRELRVVHPEWVYWADLFAVVRRGRVLSIPGRTLLREVRAVCRERGGRPAQRAR